MTDTACTTDSFLNSSQKLELEKTYWRLVLDYLTHFWQWLAKQLIIFANWLDKNRIIYALYAIDGLNITYSNIKNIFDLIYTNTPIPPTDAMHDWLLTPWGILTAVMLSVGSIFASLISNYLKEGKDTSFLVRLIMFSWLHFRHASKGLKMGFKSISNLYNIMHLFSQTTYLKYFYIIAPIGLALGIANAINRCVYAYVVQLRKLMMLTNKKLLERAVLLEKGALSDEEYLQKIAEIRQSIEYQALSIRMGTFVLAFFSGCFDSLYMYSGVLGIVALPPPIFITVLIICVFYSLLCIMVRIYEEYNYQKFLTITQENIELVLSIHELFALGKNEENIAAKKRGIALQIYKTQDLITLSYTSALITGIRDGLMLYSSFSMILMLISTIMLLTSTAFPPALIIAVVPLGLLFISFFAIRSLYTVYIHRHQNKTLAEWDKKVTDLSPEEFDTLLDIIILNPTPLTMMEAISETMRQGMCGGYKGLKSFDFVTNQYATQDIDGHYHPTSNWFEGLAFLAAGISSAILGLREFARNFSDGSTFDPSIPKKEDLQKAAKAKATPASEKRSCGFFDKSYKVVPLSSFIPALIM